MGRHASVSDCCKTKSCGIGRSDATGRAILVLVIKSSEPVRKKAAQVELQAVHCSSGPVATVWATKGEDGEQCRVTTRRHARTFLRHS